MNKNGPEKSRLITQEELIQSIIDDNKGDEDLTGLDQRTILRLLASKKASAVLEQMKKFNTSQREKGKQEYPGVEAEIAMISPVYETLLSENNEKQDNTWQAVKDKFPPDELYVLRTLEEERHVPKTPEYLQAVRSDLMHQALHAALLRDASNLPNQLEVMERNYHPLPSSSKLELFAWNLAVDAGIMLNMYKRSDKVEFPRDLRKSLVDLQWINIASGMLVRKNPQDFFGQAKQK